MSAVPDLPSIQIVIDHMGASSSPDDRATARLIGRLYKNRPAALKAKLLMSEFQGGMIGNAFAAVCFHIARANRVLAPLGWQVIKSNGTTEGTVWISTIRRR